MNILITAAGTGTAFSYAQAISKNFPSVKLFTADTNPEELVTSSIFAENHFQVDSFKSEKYFNKLNELINDFEIDWYLPLIDQEIFLSYEKINAHEKLASNSLEFCKSSVFKRNYINSFEGIGFLFPKILSKEEALGKKVIIKNDFGFGGRGTKTIIEFNEETSLDEGVIYEYIEGDEFTIDCFPFDDGCEFVVRRRVETKNGVCTKAEIFFDDELGALAKNIVKKFRCKHPFCFQLKKNEKGNYYLIDVNPRLGAGSAMSAYAGLDFFSAHIAMLLNEDTRTYLKPTFQKCFVTRQYANYLNKVCL